VTAALAWPRRCIAANGATAKAVPRRRPLPGTPGQLTAANVKQRWNRRRFARPPTMISGRLWHTACFVADQTKTLSIGQASIEFPRDDHEPPVTATTNRRGAVYADISCGAARGAVGRHRAATSAGRSLAPHARWLARGTLVKRGCYETPRAAASAGSGALAGDAYGNGAGGGFAGLTRSALRKSPIIRRQGYGISLPNAARRCIPPQTWLPGGWITRCRRRLQRRV
jgi:hypothetical protein